MNDLQSYRFMELETFRHLTDNSLMPWLSDNDHPLKFETIVRRIEKESAGGKDYFSALTEAHSLSLVKLSPFLSREWEMFSQSLPVNNHTSLKSLFGKVISRNKKYGFYYNLIAHTTLSGLGTQEQLFKSTASENLRKKMITNNMKLVIGLIQRCSGIRPLSAETADIALVLLTGLRIFFLETAINYRYFFEPHLVHFGSDEFFDFDLPGFRPEEMNSSIHTETTGLIKRFTTHYSGTGHASESETSYSGLPDHEKNALAELFTRIEKSEDFLLRFEDKHTGNEYRGKDQGEMEKTGNAVVPPVSEELDTDIKLSEESGVILPPSEVMEILGIGKTSLYKLSKSGEIPCFRIGGRYKYEKAKILKLKEKGFNK